MKEYIYVNQQLINSLLAQLDGGITSSIRNESASGEQDTQTKSDGIELTAGVRALINVSVKGDGKDVISNQLSKSQSELVDTVLDDFSIDLLLEKMADQISSDVLTTKEGDFVSSKSDFKILNFKHLSNVVNPETIEKFLDSSSQQRRELKRLEALPRSTRNTPQIKARIQELKETEKESDDSTLETMSSIHHFSNFVDKIFPDSILIKTTKAISIVPRSDLRINDSELSLLTLSNRKVRVFGLVTSIQNEIHPNGDFDEMQPENIDVIQPMFIDVLLSSFNILESKDRFIRPIAIFFE